MTFASVGDDKKKKRTNCNKYTTLISDVKKTKDINIGKKKKKLPAYLMLELEVCKAGS